MYITQLLLGVIVNKVAIGTGPIILEICNNISFTRN